MSAFKKDVGNPIEPAPRQVHLHPSEIARIQKERQLRSLELAEDQVTSMAKWLTGSLFAANSAGVITVLNAADKLASPTAPAALFACGLVFALLSGTVLQGIYNSISDPLSDLVQYWAEVEAGAELDQARQAEIVARVDSVTRWSWTAPIPGWISGFLFVGASFAVVFVLK